MKEPSLIDLRRGMARHSKGDRPWPDRTVDWFVASPEGQLFPLKYTYALATDQRPASFTTNQAKAAMRHLGLGYVSLKAQPQNAAQFEKAVAASLQDKQGRRKRLAKAKRIPVQSVVAQFVFHRNPDVVAEVLDRAAGFCEICKKKAPFLRASNGSPYLEVHHKKTLAEGGEDTVKNAVAACPNCHRRAHHG